MLNLKTNHQNVAQTGAGEPLQLRWPAAEIKAAKLEAIRRDYKTISAFLLDAFHAFTKPKKS